MAETDAWETTENNTFPSDTNTSIPDLKSDQVSSNYRSCYYSLADDINFYGLSIVIPFGLTGNLFSLLIFLTSSVLRQTTTGQYLIALACADSLLLVGNLMRWMAARQYASQHYLPESFGLNVFETSNFACKMTHFLRYGSSFCSAWITTVIAAERLVAIAKPLMIGRLSNPCRVRAVIVSIATVSYSLSAFPFWTTHIETNKSPISCRIINGYEETFKIWTIVITSICTHAIPGVLIAIFTVAIIWCLFRARRQRSQLAVGSTSKAVPEPGVSRESQLTIMLLAVCIATTALRVPYSVAYELRRRIWRSNETVGLMYDVQTYMALKVSDAFNTLNYAINFILYCLTGSLFRSQIKKLCRLCRRRENNSEAARISTETLLQSPVINQKGHEENIELINVS